MTDRRMFNRSKAFEEGFVSVVNNNVLSENAPITVLDLSLGGIGFSSPASFQVDDVITVTFSLFVDYTVTARAKVLRTSGNNCYCSFIQLSPQQETKITAYVYCKSGNLS